MKPFIRQQKLTRGNLSINSTEVVSVTTRTEHRRSRTNCNLKHNLTKIKQAVGNAHRLLQCCQSLDKNIPRYFARYLQYKFLYFIPRFLAQLRTTFGGTPRNTVQVCGTLVQTGKQIQIFQRSLLPSSLWQWKFFLWNSLKMEAASCTKHLCIQHTVVQLQYSKF